MVSRKVIQHGKSSLSATLPNKWTKKNKIKKGQDIFERGHNLRKVEIDSSFPKYILQNKDKLKKWII